ncbi:threonine synthase [bacterium]|nr:threonine synthase [bacterium]
MSDLVGFQDAALAGLASDGGLFVPEVIPRLDLEALEGLSYPEVAWRVMSPFCDIPTRDLQSLCFSAYGPEYGGEVAPLRADPWGHVLELFHGPTYSFKDVALQFLGRLLNYILEKRQDHCNLLVATSGDTGSAALRSVVGCSRLRAVVMFPKGRVSPLQELQMTTMGYPNTHCLEIDGTFDDCQAILKQLNRDADWKRQHRLGAVNSVNWARLLAQSVYYVWTWLQLGQPLQVVVPTGNFGNFLSAWLAHRMGVPTRRLALATNENDIVHRYFQTRRYARGGVHQTLAPAMDIQVASNLERFFYLAGGGHQVTDWMAQFEQSGSLDTPLLDVGGPEIVSGSANRGQILQAIRQYFQETGTVLCPHTAVAWYVSRQLPPIGPGVLVATAHPGKFPEAVGEALGINYPGHPGLEALRDRPRQVVALPAQPEAVRRWMEGLTSLG